MKNRTAMLSLLAAGSLWGITVALSKLALGWLDPSTLTAMRFLVAMPVLALIGRRGLRDALTLRVFVSGTVGYGAQMLIQNIGIEHTSVSHGAIIVGALPVVVALVTAVLGKGSTRPALWIGYAVALLGVVLVAKGGGGGATTLGDTLVLVSVILSGAFMALQPAILRGQSAAAVTAVQFLGGAAVSVPLALMHGVPAAPGTPGPLLAFLALALVGTVLPFWLFAYGQARVAPELAGAFVNLEPLVGAIVGWVAFSDPVGPAQIAGAFAVLAGILISLTPSQLTAPLARLLLLRLPLSARR